ncbi:hypothetical protein ACWGH8_06185 [Nonomuraea muscovyensis]
MPPYTGQGGRGVAHERLHAAHAEANLYLLREDQPGGARVLDPAPAQGGCTEWVFPEPGHYPFVDHAMTRAQADAHGIFEVTAP